MQDTQSSPSRRVLLGGSLATLGAAGSLATAGPAGAATGPSQSSTGAAPAAAAPPQAALPALVGREQSLYFGPLGWAAYDFAAGATVVLGSSAGSRSSAGWLGQGVALEPGSTITGLDLTVRGTGTVSGTVFLMRSTPEAAGGWSSAASAGGAAAGTFSSAPLSLAVTPATAYSLEVVLGSTSYVSGVRVRYTPPLPSGLNLVPITPARVYDSRRNMAPDANGSMSTGTNRTISVANGRDPGTGTVTLPDVVPAAAKAVAYTVTVTGTTAGGYLAVNPGGDAVVHASTINWAAGQTLANSGVIGVSPTRTITLVCGGGTTQVIIDVIGYYVS